MGMYVMYFSRQVSKEINRFTELLWHVKTLLSPMILTFLDKW